MSLLKKLGNAFGFSGGDDDDDDLIADDPETEQSEPISAGVEVPRQPSVMTSAGEVVVDTDAEAAIFEHVVKVFNQSLPDFLRSSVNESSQRQYLYQALSSDLKAYLASLGERTRLGYEQQWQSERGILQEKVHQLEEKSRDIEARREELNQQKLSAERQRRSLSDRVHVLERQVMALEAEKEQFQLESKSMSNKLKVASVHEEDVNALQQELARLRDELARAVAEKGAAAAPEEAPAEAHRENDKILEQTIRDLDEANERARSAEARLEEYTRKYDDLSALIDDAEHAQAQMHVIEQQLSQFEEIKQKKDSQIASLKDELEKASTRIADLENAMAESLALHNDGEKHYKAEIERLKQEIDSLARQNSEISRTAAQRTDLKDAPESNAASPSDIPFDDIFSDTDWVLQHPAPRQRRDSDSRRHSRGDSRRSDDDLPSLF